MMGSRSQASLHSTHPNQDRIFEPEEYDLDTFTFPVDANLNLTVKGSSKIGGSTIIGHKKKLFLNDKKSSVEKNGHQFLNSSFVLNGREIQKTTQFNKKTTSRNLEKTKKIREGQGDSTKGNQNKIFGHLHDGFTARPSDASHVLTNKAGEQKLRGLPVMGEVDGTATGSSNGRGTGGRKPTFLKTVSIIDTLSELGPEVRQLTEDPSRPPLTSKSGSSSSSRVPTNESARNDYARVAVAGSPPSVSVDFQTYTEKIYDAVTRQGRDLAPSSSRIRVKKSKSGGVKLLSVRSRSKDETCIMVEAATDRLLKLKRGTNRGCERGRTPDWIKRIFDIAKRGEIEAIKREISDMEDTLVRNLSDHAGNNLLHVMSVYGHLQPMAWMLTTQSILVDALQDENKYGLTPLVCSIKYGRLHVVQWLVENTCIKDKVKCKDGERSLLHVASKYAQEEIVAWLVEYMMNHSIPLDNKDHHGNTALHLVARTGNSRVCSILLQHGADVTLKNDLGQKAWEVCVIRGYMACAEYLCVHESGLALATDLTRREAELEAAIADNQDLRFNFKEVMNIARRLIREREEAVRELSRLHEQMVESHDNIMALHVLSEEQRDSYSGIRGSTFQREQVESVIKYVANIHERWQTLQKSWFGSSLAHVKHRMLLVEETWKKLKHRNHRTVATTHHPLDVFRGKLCAVRAQGGEGRLGDLPSLCSSEESLASLFPFSDNEEEENNYEILPSTSTPAKDSAGIINGTCYAETSEGENMSSFNDLKEVELNSKENMELKSASVISPIVDASRTAIYKFGDSQIRPYWTDPSLSASLNIVTDLSPGQQLPKDEINARLKEFALTSESGSCSVLEVIEPSSEEDQSLSDDDRQLKIGGTDDVSETKFRNEKIGKRTLLLGRGEEEDIIAGETATSSESGADGNFSGELYNKSSEGNHFLANETSVEAAVTDVSNKGQRITEQMEGQYQSFAPFKRRGFLQKLIKPANWPPMRKVKPIRKLESGVSRELPIINSSNRGIDLSSGDIETQIMPEANTSSSQAYSNSSKESSTGKQTTRPTDSTVSPNQFHLESENKNSFSNPVHDVDKCAVAEKSLVILPSSITPPPVPSRRSLLSPTPPINSIQGYNSGRNMPEKRLEKPVKNIVSEARSIATSEDSGIVAVARPSSSASKSESVSRPESSSSNFNYFKTDFSLLKSNLSLTHDMLPTPDSSTAGRMSPAPSEVSKTESALSPPSDVSKSESSRQTSMGKGSFGSSTNSNCSKEGSASSADYSVTMLSLKKDISVKTAAIISCNQKLEEQTDLTELFFQENVQRKERPWYEVSDEESDILLPDQLSTKEVPRDTSSEDETVI